MSDQSTHASELRRQLHLQLLTWLRRQNELGRTPLLDRPIVITLLGGVVAGLLTTYWQASEKHREIELTYQRTIATEQATILKEFAETYESAGGVVNGWFARVIWIADETNKPSSTQTQMNINRWKLQTEKLEERYVAAKPLDGVIPRISVLYQCPAVRAVALKMLTAWENYTSTFQRFNREWNDQQKLRDAEIKTAEDSRRTLLQNMEDLNGDLIKKMAGELIGASQSPPICP
jgi:hypothetical protein